MNAITPRFWGAVLVSMLLAVILSVVPLPEPLQMWRPEWVALALIHWALVLGHRVGLWMAFIIGLLMDVLHNSLLGQHALELVIVGYLAIRLGGRMTPEAYFQQFVLISAVLGLYMLLSLWIRGVTGYAQEGNTWQYWAPLLSSLLIWPLYQWLLSYFYIQKKGL
ncbi:rod shape-determining protein MreD [Thiofilum flexile]|uniref:rod shape-determining protein MreD n=1 Tax=Thiofilum flexile TaxID=125627 RepID=UPI0003768329|nr:rod shape-determining protein MreD [Thiofilum flexile]